MDECLLLIDDEMKCNVEIAVQSISSQRRDIPLSA